MSTTRYIMATYRGPGTVVRNLLAQGEREDRALIYLVLGCLLIFVAQTPRLAREAFLTGEDLSMLMGGTLMAWLFIMPLVLYAIGWVSYLLARILGGDISSFAARLALFWALLASCPVMLLWGLTAGFVGPGVEMNGVGLLWLTVFLCFWILGFVGATKGAE